MYELHEFNVSVCSYRVRIGLTLKGISYDSKPVSLIKGGGEQHSVEYRSLNPQGLLPTYSDDDITLSQSLAILEYLDERYPEPPLLPTAPVARARVRQIAQLLACDIQPLTNLRVLGYLRTVLRVDDNARSLWFRHWLLEGLDALELWLTADDSTSVYAIGDTISIADICIVPQLYAARRFKLPLDDFPRLCQIEAVCLDHPAFSDTRPDDA